MIGTIEKDKGAIQFNESIIWQKGKQLPLLSPFPCGAKKAASLLDQRVKDRVIHLLEVEFLHSLSDQKDVKYCLYHRIEQCATFKRIFDEKHKAGKILSQEGAVSISDFLFLSITTRQRPNDDGFAQ